VAAQVVAVAVITAVVAGCGSSGAASGSDPDTALTKAVDQLVKVPGGPPGVIVLIQQGDRRTLYRAGTAVVGTAQPITATDRVRLASVSKAYSGAVALALVHDHTLSLTDTVGKWLPGLPAAWSAVTLRQLLSHTSGIPDFSSFEGFQQAVGKDPFSPPSPAGLLGYITDPALLFDPGTSYHYSNSDNVIVGLMIEAATGQTYQQELQTRVFGPLDVHATSLPTDQVIPSPYAHGYALDPPAAPEDVSEAFAAGWAWSAGGIVSTPADTDTFISSYVDGTLTGLPAASADEQYVKGSSEPPGPGGNSAGLAVFRYRTSCGTVYGHTGNTLGYTQFAAATADGARSVVVSVTSQYSPTKQEKVFARLRSLYGLAVCAALAQ
jgi:D-alanyl-D-alanine carboxypeptidase